MSSFYFHFLDQLQHFLAGICNDEWRNDIYHLFICAWICCPSHVNLHFLHLGYTTAQNSWPQEKAPVISYQQVRSRRRQGYTTNSATEQSCQGTEKISQKSYQTRVNRCHCLLSMLGSILGYSGTQTKLKKTYLDVSFLHRLTKIPIIVMQIVAFLH